MTKNASCQHVYLHDGILVQLFAFLELLAFALLGQQLLCFFQLALLYLSLQPVLLPLDPA